MSLAPIQAPEIDAQLAALFEGLQVLGPVSSPGRVIRGLLAQATPAHRWATMAESLETGSRAAIGVLPQTADDMRILAIRLRALADGRAILEGGR